MGLCSDFVNLTKSLVRIPSPIYYTPTSSLCVVDARMIQDAEQFIMNLVLSLERVLHGKVKPSERFNYMFRFVRRADIVGLD